MRSTLGVFELGLPVGAGGQGQVFGARWVGPGAEREASGLNRRVAIKVLSAGYSRSASFLESFRREVRAAAGLSHPGVVMVLDCGEVSAEAAAVSGGQLQSGCPWLAMEMADGGTLADRCEDLTWSGLAAILERLLDVLGHAHAHGIVHRDVKMSNVLFGGWTPGPKLADFGLAHPLSDGGLRTARAGGTLSYMAPEQFDGDARDLGPWTDLYSLGCLAWRIVCAAPPYQAPGGISAMARAHQTWPIPRLKARMEVPPGLEDWLHCLIQKDPGRRFALAADARAALREVGSMSATPRPVQSLSPDRRNWPLPEPPKLWQEDRQDGRPTTGTGQLAGAGLGLFGLRNLPLVGRVRERDRLWSALMEVRQGGSARAVLLEGPAGVGKSRLASWLCARAEETGGATALRAHHSPQRAATDGLLPMAARAMRCVGLSRSLTLPRVAAWQHATLLRSGQKPDPRTTSTLTELVLPGPGPQTVSPDRLSEQTVEPDSVALHTFLTTAASDRPVVVWLDDSQWGPQALEFVEFLLANQDVVPLPVLLVLTVRRGALADLPLEEAIVSRLRSLDRVSILPIEPLPDHHRDPLVSSVLGLRGNVAAQVRERSGGNPLFAIELVRSWVERGILQASSGGFELEAGANLDIPHSLRDVGARRLERLLSSRPASDRTALERAAILGQRVSVEEWHEACASTGLQVSPSLLREVLDAHLGQVADSGVVVGWEFAHAMLRETLELGAREGDRLADHHAACARMLERRQGVGVRERLGRHLLGSGSVLEAERCLAEGLEERLASGSYVRAEGIAATHRRALSQISGSISPEIQVRADLLHGQLARARNRIGEALELCSRAEVAARSAGMEGRRAEACAELGLASYRAGDLDGCLRWARAGRVAAENCGVGPLAARCLEAEARALTDLGQLDDARRGFESAALAYDALGDRQGVASSSLGLAWLAWTHGQYDRATQLIRGAIPTFQAQGDRSRLGAALSLLGEVHRSRGELSEASRLYSQALREHRSCGSKIGATIAQLNLALVHIGCGDWTAARNAIHEVVGSMRGEGGGQFANYAELMLLVCDAAESRWADWAERFGEVERRVLEGGQVHDDLVGLAMRCAEFASTSGREELAETARAMAHGQLRGLGRDGEISQT